MDLLDKNDQTKDCCEFEWSLQTGCFPNPLEHYFDPKTLDCFGVGIPDFRHSFHCILQNCIGLQK
jgi:hypothetical protein